MNTPIEIKIPFEGFYGTHLDAFIEDTVGYFYEDASEGTEDIEYKVDFKEIAKEWVSMYSNHIEIPLKFIGLDMPREYNFRTDEITATIELADLVILHAKFKERDDAQERIDEVFKSRSGFASFYDDFVEDWKTKHLFDWDLNELMVLLPCEADEEDLFSNIYDNANMAEVVYNNVTQIGE